MAYRRFQHMQELLKEGAFFSDDEMKQRAPLLYHQYVGRYITEREAQRMARANEATSWASQLLNHIDHQNLRYGSKNFLY